MILAEAQTVGRQGLPVLVPCNSRVRARSPPPGESFFVKYDLRNSLRGRSIFTDVGQRVCMRLKRSPLVACSITRPLFNRPVFPQRCNSQVEVHLFELLLLWCAL